MAVVQAVKSDQLIGNDGAKEDATTEMSALEGNEDPGPCCSCSKPIDEGQVILFNNKCWHPACFHCITCDNLLDINMNVYLDGEGNPICANCMHNCSICNQPITDYAMMYGKEMYHEECFRCQECHAPISGTVYANTSKGVYCVNCHNERMARSRKHHEERKRRAKERAERKARQEREKLSPTSLVDRDKSLPAPPPELSPNPSITPNTLSPIPLSEAAFKNHLMGERVNVAAEEELRSKRNKRNSAMMETELKLNGLASPNSLSSTRRDSNERDSTIKEKPKRDSQPPSPEEDGEGDYLPIVLDHASLPNSPDPTQLENIIENPVLGFAAQSPLPANPQIEKPIAEEPITATPRQEPSPPVTFERRSSAASIDRRSSAVSIERKSSISTIAKEATEALGREMSLRSRRKNSKSHNAAGSQDWKLGDIPKRKNSGAPSDVPESAPLKSAIPDFPVPPSTTPLETRPTGISIADVNPTSERSASPPASPAQFIMRNDSVSISEVSTALTPTSVTFDGKSTPPTKTSSLPSVSPPIPTRHPHHHSPKTSIAFPQHSAKTSVSISLHSPNRSMTEPPHARRPSLSAQQRRPSTSDKAEKPAHHSSKVSMSYISVASSSRPSTAESDKASGFLEAPLTPLFPASQFGPSPQLPSIPSPGVFNFEDEMSQAWLQQERKGSVASLGHKRGQSSSSQTGSMFSKMTSSLRHTRSISADQRPATHAGQPSKGHSKNPSKSNNESNNALAVAEEEKAELRRQLRHSTNQIVELELKLQDGDEKDELMESKLEGQRDALAGVEAEREMALQELKVLLKHRYALDSNSPNDRGLRDTCDKILNDFEESLEKLKINMREQIKDYTSVRTQLVEETGRLRALRDNYLEEAQQLNKQNNQLSDLNNDIQRNMDRTPNHSNSMSDSRGFSLFKTQHRKDSPTTGSISSVQSVLFKNDLAHPMYFESKKSGEQSYVDSPMSKASDSTVIADEPVLSKAVVTRVSDQDSSELPPPPKKFNWKKNTAALKKNAVKGFKSVWSGDTNILVTSPGTTISSPQLVSSSSQGNGLNILLPQPRGSFDNLQSEAFKTHTFYPKTFKRWQKCGFCGDKLTGSEVRCIACEYQCHTKCLMSVSVVCTNSRNKASRDTDVSSVASETAALFGNDLSRQAELEGRPVPYIIIRCIEEVEANGMDFEGIYRKSGGASSLRAIIDAFEAGGEVNFDHLGGSGDICAVTSALKQYLRTLPDPLLPFSAYDRFLQATIGSDHMLKVHKFRGVLESLPKVNYDVLSLLMLHLARIVEKSDINLMHANNLAVVFSPTLMRDQTGARQILDMNSTNQCVKFLIENATTLFTSGKPLLQSIEKSATNESILGLSRIIDNRI